MEKKQYIQPTAVSLPFDCGQELMAGSIIEAEVYNDNFDPANMESLSRKYSVWDDEDNSTEELF